MPPLDHFTGVLDRGTKADRCLEWIEKVYLQTTDVKKSLSFQGLPPLDPITLLGYWIRVLRLIVSRMGRQGIISLMKKTPSFKELLHLDHIINICLLLVAKPPKAVGGANNF